MAEGVPSRARRQAEEEGVGFGLYEVGSLKSYAYVEVEERSRYFDEAIKIYQDAFQIPDFAVSPQRLEGILLRKGGQPRLALLMDSEVVAMAVYASFKEGNVIWYLAVKREERGKGLGSLMVHRVIDALKLGRGDFIYAEYEDSLIPFWASNGFKVIPVRYYQPPLSNRWVRINLGATPLRCEKTLSGKQVLSFVERIYADAYRVNYLGNPYFEGLRADCENLALRF